MKDYENVNETIRSKIKEIKQLKQCNYDKAKKMEDELIISLAYLVYSVIFKYKKFDNYEDLYQEGMIGLIKAVQHYNSETSFHFTRYAMWWIKTRIMRSIKKMNVVTVPNDNNIRYWMQYDLHDYDIIDYDNPELKSIFAEEVDMINLVLATFPEKHQQVIKMRYGLNNTNEYSLQDIGMNINMTREGVRQLEYRILDKIKNINIVGD